MKKYIQNRGCETTQLDNEWIILNSNNLTVTKVNEVGGYCWELLQNEQSLENLVSAVEVQFSGELRQEEITEDIKEFLDSLLQCEVIEVVV
ncbi:PqqD family protein [Falsibacillus pallidus]|uniref:Coenzyme PQQ synthesis protein D (PqqD) n=1 Tax=Falsibacillus pallidus TaxID=493781 RepID=A0A370GPS1_9BACI|nr:PqqD family protein [Falsibacillus pallidus]RDI45728.1 coenzyme PQQ synthesis protein D (PqqD) [Falsibacillus pallidus]